MNGRLKIPARQMMPDERLPLTFVCWPRRAQIAKIQPEIAADGRAGRLRRQSQAAPFSRLLHWL
jgi:hypothetical protein